MTQPSLRPMDAQLLALLLRGRTTGAELLGADPSLPRGVIYVHLSRLEDRGLLVSAPFGPSYEGMRRRRYILTPLGKEAAAHWPIVEPSTLYVAGVVLQLLTLLAALLLWGRGVVDAASLVCAGIGLFVNVSLWLDWRARARRMR